MGFLRSVLYTTIIHQHRKLHMTATTLKKKTSSMAESLASTSAPTPRIRRAAPQLLADELIASPTGELLSSEASQPGTGRLLTTDIDPWAHNAWDKVEWDEEQENIALEKVEKQKINPVKEEVKDLLNKDPAGFWDEFYAKHTG